MLQGQLKRDQAAKAVVVKDRLKGQLVEICCKGNSNSFAARAAEDGKGQYSRHTMSVLHTSLQGQPILSGRDDSQIRQGPARGARAPISRPVETRGSLESLKTERLQAAIDSALNCTFQGKVVLTSEFILPNLNFCRLKKKKGETKRVAKALRGNKSQGAKKRGVSPDVSVALLSGR